jgi:hypothetical protein
MCEQLARDTLREALRLSRRFTSPIIARKFRYNAREIVDIYSNSFIAKADTRTRGQGVTKERGELMLKRFRSDVLAPLERMLTGNVEAAAVVFRSIDSNRPDAGRSVGEDIQKVSAEI